MDQGQNNKSSNDFMNNPFNRIEILLEDLVGKNKAFGEGVADLYEKYEQVNETIVGLREEIQNIKDSSTPNQEFQPLVKRVTALEKAVSA